MKRHLIGILTWREGTRFFEPLTFRRMIKAGESLGATVFLFSVQDVSLETRQVRGFVPAEGGGWKSRWFPWPDIVLDRYRYYPQKKHQAYLPFRRQALFQYANSRFSNKWKVHQVLWQDEQMQKWLPETWEYSKERLFDMLRRHPQLYMKPANGTGGRSILRIDQKRHGYHLLGRGKRQAKREAVLTSDGDLLTFIHQWTKRERVGNEVFLLQQGLQLELMPERITDIRLLIQKTSQGKWAITGLGARIGKPKSSTSNLHGGGSAQPAGKFLAAHFGEEKALEILKECRLLAHHTTQVIENHYGRMVEFGMDIGVDANGHVWLIEVNPKPGRNIFRDLGQMGKYRQAIQRPLEYAIYLLEQGAEEQQRPVGLADFFLHEDEGELEVQAEEESLPPVSASCPENEWAQASESKRADQPDPEIADWPDRDR